jgi:hypothetical protein
MKREKSICIKQQHNPYMGVECYSSPNKVFYVDINGWVKVGDIVECERLENGHYGLIWVNGILKTESNTNDIRKRSLDIKSQKQTK